MSLRTYRARSLQEALQLVREELGPDASVLHTREVSAGVLRWIGARGQIEVTASADVHAPSRFELPVEDDNYAEPIAKPARQHEELPGRIPSVDLQDFRRQLRRNLQDEQWAASSPLEELCDYRPATITSGQHELLARMQAELSDAK